jgi:hypothetical protein
MKIIGLLLASVLAFCAHAEKPKNPRSLYGSFGTYDGEPRLPNGRIDLKKLVSELAELRANTYNFLIWHAKTDWEDLQKFLPLARKKKINVWITLVPPTESAPKYPDSEPFKQDYERWAIEIARLSVKEKNLVAWSIDDFSSGNQGFYTPEKLRDILSEARKINPNLAFIPCCYYPQLTPEFAKKYEGLLDGVLFPYLSESAGFNLTDATHVDAEIAKARKALGTIPIFLDVYATAYTGQPPTTPSYIRDVMERGWRNANGVLIYCHQDKQKSAEKFETIKQVFNTWAEPPREKFADTSPARMNVLRGSFGTYDSAPRLANGRVDCEKLISELTDLNANSYNFLIHQTATDWDDLKVFLPLAREKNLKVWVSLVPPSESAPISKLYCEPFRLDYKRWAVEFAKLSLREPNFVGWSIDDFPYNLKLFTPDYCRKMLESSRAINPKFAFLPCCYYKQITPIFVKNWIPLFDGILFPYRDESGGANLQNADHVESEIKALRGKLGPKYPIILDVYASSHSRLGASTPEYVEQVVTNAKGCADGVLIYAHQNKDGVSRKVQNKPAEKYEIIKKLFGEWRGNSQ